MPPTFEKNTIIEYLGHYFILPREPPSEILHLGLENIRRYNWYLIIAWYNSPEAHTKLRPYSYNQFNSLSTKLRQSLQFNAISRTLQEISTINCYSGIDSGKYHMTTDNQQPQHHARYMSAVEHLD